MSREVKLTFVVDDNGTVRNVLGGAADALRQVERQADESARKTGAAMDMISGGVGRVVAAIGGIAAAYKAVDAVFDQINLADDLNDLAQKTGVATETLSAYRLAAESSGTSLEGLATGFRFLARNISEGDDVLAGLLRTSTDALRMRDLTGVVNDLAGVFERLPDGTTKTRVAMELFGRAGSELIPFLNNGSQGLRDFTAAAENAGIVISGQTAKAADEFNDSLAVLKSNVSGIALTIAEALLPSLQSAVDVTGGWAAANGDVVRQDVAKWADGAATAVGALVPVIKQAYDWFNALSQAAADLYVGEGGGLLTDAARRRAGANPELMASMSDEARGFMSVGAPDIRLPPAARVGGAIDNAELRRVRGILGSVGGAGGAGGAGSADPMTAHVDAWLNRSVIEAKALNDEMAALAGNSDRASIGVSQIEQHLGGARGEASMFVQTFSDGLLSVFDALLSSGGKFDLLDVGLRSLQRSFLQTFAEALPMAIDRGLGAIATMAGSPSSAGGFFGGSFGSPSGGMRAAGSLGGMMPVTIPAPAEGVTMFSGGRDTLIAVDDMGRKYSAPVEQSGALGQVANGVTPGAGVTAQQIGGGGIGGLMSGAGIGATVAGFVPRNFQLGALAGGAAGGAIGGAIGAFFGMPELGGIAGGVIGTPMGIALSLIEGTPSRSDRRRGNVRELLLEAGLARTEATGDNFLVRELSQSRIRDLLTMRGSIPSDLGAFPGGRRRDIERLMAELQVGSIDEIMPAADAIRARAAGIDETHGGVFGMLVRMAGFEGPQMQATARSALGSRAARLGLSDSFIDYENRRIARSLGVGLDEVLTGMNEDRLQAFDEGGGIRTQEEYNALVADAVKLLTNDLPNGVDAAAIAMASMEQTTRGGIINIDEFNKKLAETTSIASALQSALTGGYGAGISGAIESIAGGRGFNRNDMRAAIGNGIFSGASSALTSTLVNSITNSSLFKDANSLLFQSISSGDASGVNAALAMFGDVTELAAAKLDALVPVIDAFGRAVSESTAQAGQYYFSARDVARARQQYVFGTLTPRGQLAAAGQSFGRLQSNFNAAMADGAISAAELEGFMPLHQMAQSQLQSVLGSLTPGSSQWRTVNQQMLSTFDFLQEMYKTAGDTITYREVNAGRLTVDELIVKNVSSDGGGGSGAPLYPAMRGSEPGGQTAYMRAERNRNRMR